MEGAAQGEQEGQLVRGEGGSEVGGMRSDWGRVGCGVRRRGRRKRRGVVVPDGGRQDVGGRLGVEEMVRSQGLGVCMGEEGERRVGFVLCCCDCRLVFPPCRLFGVALAGVAGRARLVKVVRVVGRAELGDERGFQLVQSLLGNVAEPFVRLDVLGIVGEHGTARKVARTVGSGTRE